MPITLADAPFYDVLASWVPVRFYNFTTSITSQRAMFLVVQWNQELNFAIFEEEGGGESACR